MTDKTYRPCIAIDFDGPLHAYSKGWHDGTIYDGPTPGAKAAVSALMGAGFDVVVYTARKPVSDIVRWLAAWGFPPMAVHSEKPPALAYIDDRGIHWRNWQQAIEDLREFVVNAGLKHEADAWDTGLLGWGPKRKETDDGLF